MGRWGCSQRHIELKDAAAGRTTQAAGISEFTVSMLSILQREGIRQLPGVCWYPAESAACNELRIKVASRIFMIIRP